MMNGVCMGTLTSAISAVRTGKTLKGVVLTALLWSPVFLAGVNSKSTNANISKPMTMGRVDTFVKTARRRVLMSEVVVYWVCDDPEKCALGREYQTERAALQGAALRNQYVVRRSYSLCDSTIIRKPTQKECEQ